MDSALAKILVAAAAGDFPAPDGSTTVIPQPSPRDAGVLAFTAHSVIFLDEDPRWVLRTLAAQECDPLAATMTPHFLSALLSRTGRSADTIDLLTVAPALHGAPPIDLTRTEDHDHPQVRRAHAHRDDVQIWSTPGGMIVLGRGVAGRWEIALSVEPAARQRGLGKVLAVAARHLIPPGELLWSQQAVGNVRSVRTFQAAGFRPVAAECLFNAPPLDRAALG
jgi:GNAT superfamily N-acetyltransferase